MMNSNLSVFPLRSFMLLSLLLLGVIYQPELWAADAQAKQQKYALAAQRTADDLLAKHPKLAPYFEQAVAYAVFPRVYKVASMWGLAWGRGSVIENGEFVGTTWLASGGLGFQVGAETYQQIIFFKTQEALDTYKSSRAEFAGRASGALLIFGLSADPAYLPDVAVFTDIGVGLMVEASANVVWYNYKPSPLAVSADQNETGTTP
jgi:lipid-binding SYLF domain-containing protein